jgi:Protein of unknown function (DUF4089)
VTPLEAEATLDAAAATLGLEIPAECRAGVLRHWQLVVSLAPKVMEFPLAPADEAAQVFTVVESRE